MDEIREIPQLTKHNVLSRDTLPLSTVNHARQSPSAWAAFAVCKSYFWNVRNDNHMFSREYIVLVLGFAFVLFETLIRILTLALPTSVLRWSVSHTTEANRELNPSSRFYDKSRELFISRNTNTPSRPPTPGSPRSRSEADEKRRVEEVRAAEDFEELCALWGYASESHVVQTKDGYLLGLHRLPNARGERTLHPGVRTRKPVVYLHHGESTLLLLPRR